MVLLVVVAEAVVLDITPLAQLAHPVEAAQVLGQVQAALLLLIKLQMHLQAQHLLVAQALANLQILAAVVVT
jgi:hypothetical protein